MSLRKINEVVVVEGKSDTQAIQRAFEADTIETNGSSISERVLCEIERAWKRRGVIVFTDPDSAGERIRRIISEKIPNVKHAFLSRAQATRDQKVGIEFASKEAIVQALERVRTQKEFNGKETIIYPISWEDYLAEGFTGKPYSSKFREMVADKLGIGYGNAQKFYQRLAVLRVSPEELDHAIEEARRSLSS